jgi:hypothetical protein
VTMRKSCAERALLARAAPLSVDLAAIRIGSQKRQSDSNGPRVGPFYEPFALRQEQSESLRVILPWRWRGSLRWNGLCWPVRRQMWMIAGPDLFHK